MSRRTSLFVRCVALLIAAMSTAYLLQGATRRRMPPATVDVPQVRIEVDAAGNSSARLDDEALRQAFSATGLPDPPPLDRCEPATAALVFSLLRGWIAERDPAAVGQLGQVFLAIEQAEQALQFFAAAAQLAPAQEKWTYLLGVSLHSLGRTGGAIEQLERAAKMNPGYAATHLRLGELHLESGDPAAARRYQVYVNLRPHDAQGHIGLGRAALAQGDAGAAERHLRQAVEKSPNDYRAHRFLSQALARRGRIDEAVRASETSLKLPEYRGWLMFDERLLECHQLAHTQRHLQNQVRVHASSGDWAAAAACAEELVRRRPGDHDMLTALAAIYHHLGQPAKSDEAIARAIELSPGSEHARLTEAQLSLTRREYERAGRAAGAVLALNPQSVQGHEIMARVLYVRRDLDGALTAVRRALQIEPERREAQGVYVGILIDAGRKEEARAYLDEQLRRHPEDSQLKEWREQVP